LIWTSVETGLPFTLVIVQGGDNARLLGTPPVEELVCHGVEMAPEAPVTFWKVVTNALQVTFGFQAETD
jgi:hypothetical protein